MNHVYNTPWITFAVFLSLFTVAAQRSTAQAPFTFDFSLEPVSKVNTSSNDYAPVLSSDASTIYLTSYRGEGSEGEADVYFANYFSAGWSPAVNFGSKFNTADNEGGMSIAGDGRTVVFAADGRDDSHGETDLYIGFLENNRIARVENLGEAVNSRHWDSQPSITADGRTIYFASDRSGGEGSIDIWMTRLGNDGWQEAVNLGPGINTGDRDLSPAVSPDGGTLIFGSDRDGGRGGLDLWMATSSAGGWGRPVNLGDDLNSPADDLFMHAPHRHGEFYFATSRSGGKGGFDIWSGRPNVFGDGMFHLTLRAIDSLTGLPVSARVSINDISTGQSIATVQLDGTAEGKNITLPAERGYRLTGRHEGGLPAFAEVVNTPPGTGRDVLLEFGKRQLVLFDLGRFNIPFFVTGYYRPNTLENLRELIGLRHDELREATYIEDVSLGSERHQEYVHYSSRIDSILEDMVSQTVDIIAPAIASQTDSREQLEIVVTGFVDPDQFVGTYHEATPASFVTTDGRNITVSSGDLISNLELSGLRAFYSQQEIDRLLTEASRARDRAFLDLKESGRLTYRVVAGGVSGDSKNYDEQRRIHVTIRRR